MFKWNVEDMELMNSHKVVVYNGCKNPIYAIERDVSREDKIAFVDSMNDGKLSYLLELQEKFDNDTKYARPIIDDGYHYGEYRLCGVTRTALHFIQSKDFYRDYDTYSDFVDECFHRQLILCEDMERKYFREHDEYSILLKKIDDYSREYGTTFGVHLGGNCGECYCYVYDEHDTMKNRKLTLEEARLLVSKYEELEDCIEKLSSEVSIKYAEELDGEKITQKNNNYERD